MGVTSVAAILPITAQGAEPQPPVEEIIVTGSRIEQPNVITSSPVTQVNQETIQFTGSTRVEDIVKNIPSAYSSQNSGTSNGSTGTATINLRSLDTGDAVRTLILINGRRMPAGSPISGGTGPDINEIPAALIDHVDVLTGGASSTYGSDAVAGVVNFVMMDNFQGVSVQYQYSQFMHDNDSDSLKNDLIAQGFTAPEGRKADGNVNDASIIIGGNLEDGRGNITVYGTYRKIDAVLQAERDYSACALNSPPSDGCGGSATTPWGTFTDFATYAFQVQGTDFVPTGAADGVSDLYNYGALNYFQRPDTRYTAGLFAHYDLTERNQMYAEFSFMDDHTTSQGAPSGDFFVAPIGSEISCGNPLLSAQEFQQLCGQFGKTAADTQTIYIGRRNVEGGPRDDDLRHTSYRGVFGFKGDIDDTWRYDAYGQYSTVVMQDHYKNDMSTTRINRSLNVVIDPATGQPACQSVVDGSDPKCVPWNIFETGGVTQAAIDYLSLPLFADGNTQQRIFSGYVAGDLGNYGVKSPWAESGIQTVFGSEYRKESLKYDPDQGYQSGDGAGQGGAQTPVDGSYNVKELFTEASVPIVEGKRFMDSVVLDLGYRWSDYSTGFHTNTYKFAGTWALNQDVKFRASYNRAVRAANVRELFLPQGLNLFDGTDPCAGALDANGLTAAGLDFAQCARTGVTAARFGLIPLSPAGQYNYLQGGNPNLEPEVSDTFSYGIVFTPGFVEGLTVTVDYFDIQVNKAISFVQPEATVTQCALTGQAQYCNNVKRGDNNESLWIGSDLQTSGYVTATNVNIGQIVTKGIDTSVDYTFDMKDWGSLSFNDILTYTGKWDQTEVKGQPVEHCAGFWGSPCSGPIFKYRNNFRTTWATPWRQLQLSAMWRHQSDAEESGGNINLSPTDYFDFAGIWPFNDTVTIRAGVNNVFDQKPQLAGVAAGPSIDGNGNTFPGAYDVLGQYYFFVVDVKL
jgi:outer membrane receptor protein involved in Fe transport